MNLSGIISGIVYYRDVLHEWQINRLRNVINDFESMVHLWFFLSWIISMMVNTLLHFLYTKHQICVPPTLFYLVNMVVNTLLFSLYKWDTDSIHIDRFRISILEVGKFISMEAGKRKFPPFVRKRIYCAI